MITFSVDGPSIYLPSQQATASALVINELIQNAVEHGFETRQAGSRAGHCWKMAATLCGSKFGTTAILLPPDFDMTQTNSLGLQIVRTLVQGDLHGRLELRNEGDEVVASS